MVTVDLRQLLAIINLILSCLILGYSMTIFHVLLGGKRDSEKTPLRKLYGFDDPRSLPSKLQGLAKPIQRPKTDSPPTGDIHKTGLRIHHGVDVSAPTI